jgi:hypothetical protein
MASNALLHEAISRGNTLLASVSKSSENLVEIIDNVMDDLRRHGGVYRMKIKSTFVIPARTNRNLLGLIPYNMHKLGDDLFGQNGSGFSRQEAEKNALCAELGDDADEDLAAYIKLVTQSNGMVAPIESLQPRYASSGGSHLCGFANATKASCRTPFPNLTDHEGKIDESRLRTKSPRFAEGLDEGWEFDVVSAKVVKNMPKLMLLAQEARNIPMQVGNQESDVQIMKKTLHEANDHQKLFSLDPRVGPTNWAEIGRAAARSKPPCASYIDSIVKWARIFGGGADGSRLNELDTFIKVCGYGGRSLGGPFLQKLTESDIGGGPLECDRFRLGIYKYMVSNGGKVVGGVSTAAKDTDLAKLLGLSESVREANELMNDARNVAREFNFAPEVEAKVMGMLDIRVVCHVWGRKSPEPTKFNSVYECADKFVNDCNVEYGSTVESPWREKAAKSREDAAQGVAPKRTLTPMPQNLIERDARGALKDPSVPLREVGFSEGCALMDKTNPEVSRLLPIELNRFLPSGVEIKSRTCAAKSVVPYRTFLETYRLDATVDPDTIANWRALSPVDHINIKMVTMKADVMRALAALWATFSVQYDRLRIDSKPKRVLATANIAKGSLKLVPLTFNVSAVYAADYKPPTFPSITLGELISGTQPKVFNLISAMDVKDGTFINPWWFVATTTDDREANLAIEAVKHVGDLVTDDELPTPARNLVVPMLVNTKKISEGDQLLMHVPKKGAAPPTAATTPTLRRGGAVRGRGRGILGRPLPKPVPARSRSRGTA